MCGNAVYETRRYYPSRVVPNKLKPRINAKEGDLVVQGEKLDAGRWEDKGIVLNLIPDE